jgi:integrase
MSGKARNGDGSIFRAAKPRADGTYPWHVQLVIGHKPDGKPIRTTRTVDTYQDAKALLKQMQADLLAGRLTKVHSASVLTYGLSWIHDVKALQVRPTTAYDYEDRLRRTIAPYLGHIRLVDLTPGHVERWLADLRRAGLSPTTINGARQVLHALCKHAQRTGTLAHNPVSATDPVKRHADDPTRVRPAWTLVETSTVLRAAVGSDPLDAFLHLMLHTGLRPGEALGLRWCDVDIPNRRLYITGTQKEARRILPAGRGVVRSTRNDPKTAASRRNLPIPDALLAALDRQQERQAFLGLTAGSKWTDSGYVVTTSVGTPVSPSNLRVAYAAFLTRNGVRYIRFHDLRHTAATRVLNDADVPIEKVSQALGHTRIDTTKQIYAKSVPQYNDAFVEGLSGILPAAPVTESGLHPRHAVNYRGGDV